MSPHARAFNTLATAIGRCFIAVGAIVLLCMGIDALKAITPPAYGPFIVLGMLGLVLVGIVYGAALDFAKADAANDKADQARRRRMEDELTRLRAERKEPTNEW